MSPRIAEIVVADEPAAWRQVGFDVDDQGRCQIGSVVVRLDPDAGSGGVRSWALAHTAVTPDLVDGLPTTFVDDVATIADGAHPNGTASIDHVVVVTPDLQRTCAALEALGSPVLRTRDTEAYGAPARQAFLRWGEVIVEVVGPAEPSIDGGRARFYGLALTMHDLDAAKALLGERMGTPKAAVQPGRMITTIKDLRVAVAVMSPEP